MDRVDLFKILEKTSFELNFLYNICAMGLFKEKLDKWGVNAGTLLLILMYSIVYLKTAFHSYFGYFIWQHGVIANHFQIENLLPALFLHVHVWHLVFNMLFLWIFGSVLEQRLGTFRYLAIYVLGGLMAFWMHHLSAFGVSQAISSVGSTGAISVVLGMHYMFFSEIQVKGWSFIYNKGVSERYVTIFFLGLWFFIQFWDGGFFIRPRGWNGINPIAVVGAFLFGLYIAAFRKYYFNPKNSS